MTIRLPVKNLDVKIIIDYSNYVYIMQAVYYILFESYINHMNDCATLFV